MDGDQKLKSLKVQGRWIKLVNKYMLYKKNRRSLQVVAKFSKLIRAYVQYRETHKPLEE